MFSGVINQGEISCFDQIITGENFMGIKKISSFDYKALLFLVTLVYL